MSLSSPQDDQNSFHLLISRNHQESLPYYAFRFFYLDNKINYFFTDNERNKNNHFVMWWESLFSGVCMHVCVNWCVAFNFIVASNRSCVFFVISITHYVICVGCTCFVALSVSDYKLSFYLFVSFIFFLFILIDPKCLLYHHLFGRHSMISIVFAHKLTFNLLL